MKPAERIEAAIAGRAVDRIPWALWRHFPNADQTAEGLADAVLSFQKKFAFDFVKVTPTNGLFMEAWGGKLAWRGNPEGTRDYLKRPVVQPSDWRNVVPLRMDHPLIAREVKAIRLISSALAGRFPLFQTIFNPLAIAKNLAGDVMLMKHLRDAPDDLENALEVINKTTLSFARECLDAGADSIFFATNTANPAFLTKKEYKSYGVPYDLYLLSELKPQSRFVLLHIHGEKPYFDLFTDYPADIWNWHDRRTAPPLKYGLARIIAARATEPRTPTSRAACVLGGLDEWDTLLKGPESAIAAEVQDAISQTSGTRFILGAGCVVPITTPDFHLRTAHKRLG
ncbi:MAG: uroporphyrinogen decarboxylase family protein [bacterium]